MDWDRSPEWRRLGHPLRAALRTVGLDLVRFPRGPLLEHLSGLQIDTVLDVGANHGQYGSSLRSSGFTGRIVSFEPGRAAFDALARVSAVDPGWTCINEACGGSDGVRELGVAAASVFSSLRAPLPDTTVLTEEAAIVRRETVVVRRLDSQWDALGLGGRRVWLKSDTQGFDREVILGAGMHLRDVVGIQVELSVAPLYEQQPVWTDMIAFLQDAGFVLSGLLPGLHDATRWRLMEVDGLFVNAAKVAHDSDSRCPPPTSRT